MIQWAWAQSQDWIYTVPRPQKFRNPWAMTVQMLLRVICTAGRQMPFYGPSLKLTEQDGACCGCSNKRSDAHVHKHAIFDTRTWKCGGLGQPTWSWLKKTANKLGYFPNSCVYSNWIIYYLLYPVQTLRLLFFCLFIYLCDCNLPIYVLLYFVSLVVWRSLLWLCGAVRTDWRLWKVGWHIGRGNWKAF